MLRFSATLVALFLIVSPAHGKSRHKAAEAFASLPPQSEAFPFRPPFLGDDLIGRARFYLGTNPTNLRHQWCARFLRMILPQDPGPDFDAARAFGRIGRPGKAGAGAIVYWAHHVGVVTSLTRPGYAMVISGNTGPKGQRVVMEQERSLAGARFRYI